MQPFFTPSPYSRLASSQTASTQYDVAKDENLPAVSVSKAHVEAMELELKDKKARAPNFTGLDYGTGLKSAASVAKHGGIVTTSITGLIQVNIQKAKAASAV